MRLKNLLNLLSEYFYLFESCIHLTCQMSSIQNARIQNVVQRCKESIKEPVLVLYPAVGYALIAECSKKTINPTETYVAIRECLKKRRI